MHEGVARNGSHLFPVLSYDHFTGPSDDDVRALYAYFMTRTPVHASASAWVRSGPDPERTMTRIG